MDCFPTSIERSDDETLEISWSDGERRRYSIRELRDSCPCATCREKRSEDGTESAGLLPVISLEEAQPLRVTGMQPVGSYAYTIAFSDGHDTGIFEFTLLRELGEAVPAA